MCQALEDITAVTCVVSGEFYAELLKALALKGFLSEAERVLAVGLSGLLRSHLDDSSRIAVSEDLVARLLEQKNLQTRPN